MANRSDQPLSRRQARQNQQNSTASLSVADSKNLYNQEQLIFDSVSGADPVNHYNNQSQVSDSYRNSAIDRREFELRDSASDYRNSLYDNRGFDSRSSSDNRANQSRRARAKHQDLALSTNYSDFSTNNHPSPASQNSKSRRPLSRKELRELNEKPTRENLHGQGSNSPRYSEQNYTSGHNPDLSSSQLTSGPKSRREKRLEHGFEVNSSDSGNFSTDRYQNPGTSQPVGYQQNFSRGVQQRSVQTQVSEPVIQNYPAQPQSSGLGAAAQIDAWLSGDLNSVIGVEAASTTASNSQMNRTAELIPNTSPQTTFETIDYNQDEESYYSNNELVNKNLTSGNQYVESNYSLSQSAVQQSEVVESSRVRKTEARVKNSTAELLQQVDPEAGVQRSKRYSRLDEGNSNSGRASAANALIEPDPIYSLAGPLNRTGEIILTGSLDLPRNLSEKGAFGRIDSDDFDDILDVGENNTRSDPMRATKSVSAISVDSGSFAPIRPNSPLPTILSIAGVVIGVLAVGIFGFIIFSQLF